MLRNAKVATFQNATQFTSQTEQHPKKTYGIRDVRALQILTFNGVLQSTTTIFRSTTMLQNDKKDATMQPKKLKGCNHFERLRNTTALLLHPMKPQDYIAFKNDK